MLLNDLFTIMALVCAITLAGLSWLVSHALPIPARQSARIARRLMLALWNILAVVCLLVGTLGLIIWR